MLATSTYDQFIKQYPGHEFISTAELGKIVCMESQGIADKALKAYGEFAAKHTNDVLYAESIFGQARCMEELGQLEKAKQVYEEFIAAHTDSVWKAHAEMAMESVDTRMRRSKGTL